MSAVLSVLKQAGTSAGNRSTVVHDFFAIKNRQSVLGTYSIELETATRASRRSCSARLKSGQLVPVTSVQG